MKDDTLVLRDGIVDHVGKALDASAAEHEDALGDVSHISGGKRLLRPNQ